MVSRRFLLFPLLAVLMIALPAAGETLDAYFTCRFSRSPAVYTGPSDTYFRAGRAQYGSPGQARVYGEENGWLLIGYQTSSGRYRLGYIDASAALDKMVDAPADAVLRSLSFDYTPVWLTRDCGLTDDPVISRAPIDSLGCPLDSDDDGVADWADQCPGTQAGAFIDVSGCPTNPRQNFNIFAKQIRFKGQDTVLYNSSYTALNDIVYHMRQYPVNLEIQCSASDASGENASRISNERAEFIYNYLVKKGISKDRLKFQGFGKKLPPTQTQKNDSADAVRFIPSRQLELDKKH